MGVTQIGEVNLDVRVGSNWTASGGVRKDSRPDNSPVVPLTQVQGDRTDAVARLTYDSREKWTAYGYAQETVSTTGNRENNARLGTGGSYRLNDRFRTSAEVSSGDLGLGARLGTEYLYSDRTTTYLNYALENERSDNGVRANKGNTIGGVRSHYSDTITVFGEEKYSHGDVPTGLTHAAGVQYAPTDRWNFSTNIDRGALKNNRTGANMERSGFGFGMGYGFNAIKLASVFELRRDTLQSPTDLSNSTRSSFLTKNSLKYQINPNWRLISKLNYFESKSSQGAMYDGTFTEAVLGYLPNRNRDCLATSARNSDALRAQQPLGAAERWVRCRAIVDGKIWM